MKQFAKIAGVSSTPVMPVRQEWRLMSEFSSNFASPLARLERTEGSEKREGLQRVEKGRLEEEEEVSFSPEDGVMSTVS